MASNPMVLLPITGRVCICSGCRAQFTDREWKQPQELVFRIQMNKQYPKDGQIKKSLKKSNVFFYMRNLGCVRQIKELAYVECNHIYMTNVDFLELTHEHIDLLKRCYYWDYIERNRQKVANN